MFYTLTTLHTSDVTQKEIIILLNRLEEELTRSTEQQTTITTANVHARSGFLPPETSDVVDSQTLDRPDRQPTLMGGRNRSRASRGVRAVSQALLFNRHARCLGQLRQKV
jgi:hypothetical protein